MRKTHLIPIAFLLIFFWLAGPVLTMAENTTAPATSRPDALNSLFPRGPDSNGDQAASPTSAETLPKHIEISLKDQTLTYFLGPDAVKTIKISSGIKGKETPIGTFTIDKKLDEVLYKGPGYYYPHTKWNMRFKQSSLGNYYIHGAYWHHRFGHPASHGCVNVSYIDMEPLYNWTPVGTQVIITN